MSALTEATLFRINPATDDLESRLAESWTEVKPLLIYKVELRPGVLWSDGSPLTASEVAASLESAADRLQEYAGGQPSQRPWKARATGAGTVEISFTDPFAPGLRALIDVPIAAAGKWLGPFMPDGPKGAGPRDGVLEFTRNPHYWATAKDGAPLPYLDRIVLELSAQASDVVTRVIAGDLDFVETEIEPPSYLALKQADRDNKVHLYDVGPTLSVDVISPASEPAGATARQDFWEAISMAINRRELCDAVYLGACDPVITPITPGNGTWFAPDLPVSGANPTLARSMLAGLDLPERAMNFTLLVPPGSPVLAREVEAIRDQLKAAGITMTTTATKPYDAVLGRLVMRDTDPAMEVEFWRFDDPRADWQRKSNSLMTTVAASPDKVARLQAFAEVQKLYAEHQPMIALTAPYTYVVTGPRVFNVRVSKRRPVLLWNADMLAK